MIGGDALEFSLFGFAEVARKLRGGGGMKGGHHLPVVSSLDETQSSKRHAASVRMRG